MGYELITTDGVFSLDGGDFEVTNNIWIVGNDREVVVFDPAHDHRPIVDAISDRLVRAIICTHGHNDHINAAGALSDIVDAPITIHPLDRMLWDVVYPTRSPDRNLAPGTTLKVAGHELAILHTPGHSPGCCCFYDSANGIVLSGDTLFCGGPGATGRSFSDYSVILNSIRSKLMNLPDHVVVHTGHGSSTTIGAEREGIVAKLAEQAESALQAEQPEPGALVP